MYKRKTKDIWVVQGFYCGSWEDLTASYNYREARADFKAYRENEIGVAHRMIIRRERIENNN